MGEEAIRDSLRTWVFYARTVRKQARIARKFFPGSLAAAESVGIARGILIMARSMKGYQTQARFVNQRRRAA